MRTTPYRCELLILGLLLWVFGTPVMADGLDPLAVDFGTIPALWNVSMSPDGEKVSLLQMHSEDLPILTVFDINAGKSNLALASTPDEFSITWCAWANNARLLCGFQAVAGAWDAYAVTRLVAVNADGSEMKVLLQQKLKKQFSQFQDRIVDWLVDDPHYVLVVVPESNGSSVQRLDIYSGRTSKLTRAR